MKPGISPDCLFEFKLGLPGDPPLEERTRLQPLEAKLQPFYSTHPDASSIFDVAIQQGQKLFSAPATKCGVHAALLHIQAD
ncbi:MAG TPA: hypothetical protein PLE72_06620 [Azospira sp.]|jgi:hypothetical protein|nr:hypothetical protein [Azospira sp.]HNN08974.1 hypothetical protein [Azospira sp.]HNN46232.1 hypothetical protein [Azospira sp.]